MVFVGFDFFYYFFYVLYCVVIGNQYGVFGLYYYQIFYIDGGYQVGFGVNVVVFCFMVDDVVVVDIFFWGVGVDFLQ